MEKILILEERKNYHKFIVENNILSLSSAGIASNADSSNTPSIAIARIIAEKLNANVGAKLKGQTAGNLFERATLNFLEKTFQHLNFSQYELSADRK